MAWTVIEADGNGVRETRRGGTLTGETLAEVAEAKRDRAIAWADITRREIPAEMDGGRDTSTGGTQAGETEVEPEAKHKALTAFRSLSPDYTPLYIPPWQDRQPEGDPKPKLVTWRLCVRIRPDEICDGNFYAECEWYRSGDIPEHWYPVEAQSQPIETIKQLPEGQTP